MGYAALTEEGYKKRIKTLTKAVKEAMNDVDNIHVKLQKGNRKTGSNCYTVSLMPVLDCNNSSKCSHSCYDLKSDLFMTTVVKDRAKNSAVHKIDPKRYWSEIDTQVKANYVRELRINVGGGLDR